MGYGVGLNVHFDRRWVAGLIRLKDTIVPPMSDQEAAQILGKFDTDQHGTIGRNQMLELVKTGITQDDAFAAEVVQEFDNDGKCQVRGCA